MGYGTDMMKAYENFETAHPQTRQPLSSNAILQVFVKPQTSQCLLTYFIKSSLDILS